MANSIQMNPGSGGDLADALDKGGNLKTPVTALAYTLTSTAGSATTQLVGTANPLPAVLGAGSNVVGKFIGGDDSSALYDGTSTVVPKFATFTASSSGDNLILAAVSGKKIRVLRWRVSASGTVNVKWRSATTDISGLSYMIANCSAGGAYCPVGVFQTATNTALNLNLSAAIAVSGEITYIEVN